MRETDLNYVPKIICSLLIDSVEILFLCTLCFQVVKVLMKILKI